MFSIVDVYNMYVLYTFKIPWVSVYYVHLKGRSLSRHNVSWSDKRPSLAQRSS